MVSDRQKSRTEKVDLEAHEWLAERASMATNMAYMRAKKLSCAVVVSKAGYIVEEHPDGSERILGVSARRKVVAGVPLKAVGGAI